MNVLLVKKFLRKLRFLLILPFFFNSSCVNSQKNIHRFQITHQEYLWLEKFFRYFLFYEGGIYTLAGSKPMTEMQVVYRGNNFSQLSEKELDGLAYFEINRGNKDDMLLYKNLTTDQKKKAILISGKDYIYDIDELWEQWKNIEHRFPISKRFLLVRQERSLEDIKRLDPNVEKIIDVRFINVFQTALILQKYYDLFKRAVGFDFDPLQTVFELDDKSSEFWNRIKGCNYSYLWGLLYGFGEENTWGYFWKGRHIVDLHKHEKEVDFAKLSKKQSSRRKSSSEREHIYSIADFPIPSFASFSVHDPTIIKYESEKKSIQNLYKGRDFVDFTLQLLTQELSE